MRGAVVHVHGDNALGAEAGVHRQQLLQTTHEEQRARQQHQRHGNLCHDEASSQAEALTARCQPTSTGAHHRCRGDARGAQRRHQSEKHAGHDGHGRRKAQHPPIHAQSYEHLVTIGRQKGDQRVAQQRRQHCAECRPQQRKKQTFRKQLRHQPSARRADGLILSGRKTGVLLVVNDSNPVFKRLQNVYGSVGRVIVDYDDLYIGVALIQNRIEAALDESPTVISDDCHRNRVANSHLSQPGYLGSLASITAA